MAVLQSNAILAQVVQQNNSAAAHIEHGEYSDAMRNLSSALIACRTSMKTMVASSSSTTELNDTSAKTNTNANTTRGCLDQCLVFNHQPAGSSTTTTCHQEEGGHEETTMVVDAGIDQHYIHRRPMTLPSYLLSTSLCSYEATVVVLIIVTFNLGLTLNLNAQQVNSTITTDGVAGGGTSSCPHQRLLLLSKASKLYELAISLMQKETLCSMLDDWGSSTAGISLFVLAIANNLGLVYRQINQISSADKCFEYVLSTLMLLTDCGAPSCDEDDANGRATISQYQFEGFFRNATNAGTSIVRFAPAA